MSKILRVLLWISVFIVVLNIVNIFICKFPIEFSNEFSQFTSILLLLTSLIFIGFILSFYFYKKKGLIKNLISFLGLIIILSSVPLFFITNWINKTSDEEKVILQSLENKNEQILYQYFDEGSIGSHIQEVRIYKLCCGIRYSKIIKETVLNGKWVKLNNNQKIDTINYVNYNYKAEH